MGLGRFLYDNKVTFDVTVTVSSLRDGMVTSALKNGTGSAVITAGGIYAGNEDLEYVVEIDSIAGGAEVGKATFKWSDGSGAWNASVVTTDSVEITLNNGVTVKWASGTGADFVVGDKWYFKGVNLFNAEKMIDMNRDSRYRSAELESPNTITIDLGTAREVEALILFDHNLTSAATITLEADDAATFDSDVGNPQFTEAVTWAEEKILHYLSAATTKRYWRVKITDLANGDQFIEIGELFLGPYMEPSVNYSIGSSRGINILSEVNKSPYGVRRNRFYNVQRDLKYQYEAITQGDMDNLESMLSSILSRSEGILKPFYFNEDSASPSDVWMVYIDRLPRKRRFGSYYDVDMSMTEVVTSV